MTLEKKIVYVTGLPRSGSTLMCQLLGHHPDIDSPGHSSPLSQIVNNIRYNASDNEFLLAQLDVDFDRVYGQLVSAYRGFINGWFARIDRPIVVDKNRFWLRMVETVRDLDPDFHMIVCVRDIAQIIGSIEAQHGRTRLLDFPDHLDPHSAHSRAERLLAAEGVVGMPLKSIEYMQDVADPALRARLCYVAYESLTERPEAVMKGVFEWLGLTPPAIDPENLTVGPHESDSYYRFKFRHDTRSAVEPRHEHEVPNRVADMIHQNFGWFYEQFYPAKTV